MDLERELVAVLDNPSEVWAAVLANLEADSRTLLLVLTTCPTPVTMIEWQEAVARVSTDAAVGFERGLRPLDDTFINTHKSYSGHFLAAFRNPSMADFCAEHLDRNVGLAVGVATKDPSERQVLRLQQLGTSRSGSEFTYPNIQQALIADPTLLLTRLLHFLPRGAAMTAEASSWKVESAISLIGHATALLDTELERARKALHDVLVNLTFTWTGSLLQRLTDKEAAARGLRRLVGRDFARFYERVWRSANNLSDFDSLVNFETYLGMDSGDVPWREEFLELTDTWLEGDIEDADEASTLRDYYSKVTDYLDLQDLARVGEWDELVEYMEENHPAGADEGPEDDSWRSRRSSSTASEAGKGLLGQLQEASRAEREIDAMFAGLTGIVDDGLDIAGE